MEQTTPMEQIDMPPRRSFKKITIIAGVIVVLATAGYFVATKYSNLWTPWKTYQSASAGIEMKYPPTWHYQECTDTGPDGMYILIAFGDAANLVVCNSDAPFQGYFAVSSTPGTINEQEIASTAAAIDGSTRTDITIDGVSAIRLDGLSKQLDGHSAPAGQNQVFVWAEKNNRLYRILFAGSPENLTQFEKALKTVTFTAITSTSETYRNDQYGFILPLPESWKEYTVRTEQWEGVDVASGTAKEHGPKIILRHPQWTAKVPREDIPVLVLTHAQWDLVAQEKISLGAAPMGPSKLAENAKYVFALPARYNYDYAVGWEEVEQILKGFAAL